MPQKYTAPLDKKESFERLLGLIQRTMSQVLHHLTRQTWKSPAVPASLFSGPSCCYRLKPRPQTTQSNHGLEPCNQTMVSNHSLKPRPQTTAFKPRPRTTALKPICSLSTLLFRALTLEQGTSSPSSILFLSSRKSTFVLRQIQAFCFPLMMPLCREC